jgi:hypothetical protein
MHRDMAHRIQQPLKVVPRSGGAGSAGMRLTLWIASLGFGSLISITGCELIVDFDRTRIGDARGGAGDGGLPGLDDDGGARFDAGDVDGGGLDASMPRGDSGGGMEGGPLDGGDGGQGTLDGSAPSADAALPPEDASADGPSDAEVSDASLDGGT